MYCERGSARISPSLRSIPWIKNLQVKARNISCSGYLFTCLFTLIFILCPLILRVIMKWRLHCTPLGIVVSVSTTDILEAGIGLAAVPEAMARRFSNCPPLGLFLMRHSKANCGAVKMLFTAAIPLVICAVPKTSSHDFYNKSCIISNAKIYNHMRRFILVSSW